MVDISRGATVYLDTNVLIYMTEGAAAFKKSLEVFFKKAIAAEAQFVTSELAFMEVLVRPIRDKNESLLVAYNDLFERFVKALPINRAILNSCRGVACRKVEVPDTRCNSRGNG